MSQSNEYKNKQELKHENDQHRSPDEFTQYLRTTFRPRAAQVSVDEIQDELSPDSATKPILFPVHATADQTTNTQSSWMRVGVAWACGMVMGAAITALLIRQDQTSFALKNNGEGAGLVSNVESSIDNQGKSNSKENSLEGTSPLIHFSPDYSDPRESHDPIAFLELRSFESSKQIHAHLSLRNGTQPNRSSIQQIPDESFTNDFEDVSSKSSTLRDDFETPDRKSDRKSLLREFLSEII